MPISSIPSTPYGEIRPHWREWLDALERWEVPAHMPRPRLYQPAGDREAVRKRVRAVDGLRASLEKAAQAACEGDLPEPTDDPRPITPWMGRATACADWWLVSGDERAAVRAWEIAQKVMVWPRWVTDEHLPLTIDLRSGAALHALAVVLDRLDDWLSEADRQRLINAIIERGVKPFVEISDAHSEWWTYSLHNWRSVITGQIGIAALSAMDSVPLDLLKRALTHSLIGVLTVLDQGDVDGGWFEGMGYWRYGIGEAVQFIDVLSRVSGGKIDLFAHPYLRKTGDFGLYNTWPDGRVFHWGDCGERVNASALMARLAKAARRADWQAYVRAFPALPSLETLFWEDPDLEAAPPESLPRVKHFRGNETAVLRSGWGKDDLIVGIKAGQTVANHSHLDIGSFVLVAGGHSLVDDGGHWPYGHALGFFDLGDAASSGRRWDFPGLASECHSTILVDGQGQRYGPEHDGVIVAANDGPGFAFATVDATRAYPQLSRFVRYFLLVRPDTLVVVDDLAAPDPRRFGWRAILPYPTERVAWPVWVARVPDTALSLTIRCLAPLPEEGLIAEQTQMDVVYPATSGLAEPRTSMLTISQLIRSRERKFVVAMRVGREEPVEPEVSVEHVYRALRVTAQTPAGKRTWSIMWGEPGVQLLT